MQAVVNFIKTNKILKSIMLGAITTAILLIICFSISFGTVFLVTKLGFVGVGIIIFLALTTILSYAYYNDLDNTSETK